MRGYIFVENTDQAFHSTNQEKDWTQPWTL